MDTHNNHCAAFSWDRQIVIIYCVTEIDESGFDQFVHGYYVNRNLADDCALSIEREKSHKAMLEEESTLFESANVHVDELGFDIDETWSYYKNSREIFVESIDVKEK